VRDKTPTTLFVKYQQTYLGVPDTKCFLMETLADRVAQRMRELGLNQSEFARRCGHGVKQQNIQQLLGGTVRQPRYIVALAAALGITIDWLLTGRVPKYVKAARFNSQPSKCPLANNVLKRGM
jgi:transcriptional regulator with XRE-family HTH domain